jgi:hypothetical protein
MLSMPPAMMHSASPALTAWAASIAVLRELPQTLLTAKAVRSLLSPGLEAGLAGGILTESALEHTAHDEFIELILRGGDFFEDGLDGQGAELR